MCFSRQAEAFLDGPSGGPGVRLDSSDFVLWQRKDRHRQRHGEVMIHNCYISMENHHFVWVNQIVLWNITNVYG